MIVEEGRIPKVVPDEEEFNTFLGDFEDKPEWQQHPYRQHHYTFDTF